MGGVPLALSPKSEFLGRDVSSLAGSIMGFYPEVAALETAKVLGLAFALAYVVLWSMVAARRILRRRRWPALTSTLMVASPILAYGAWLGATVISFPALFEESLPASVQRLVFQAAFRVQPSWLFAAAAGLALVPASIVGLGALVSRPRKRAVLVPTIIGVTASALLVAMSWSDPGARSGADARPDVLFIAVDSLRFDRLQRPEVLPRLRELLEDPQTVAMNDHWVGIPRTFPSWVEMIQGRPAATTGIRHMFPGFGPREKEFGGLVTAYRDAGYRTVAVSDFAGDVFPRFEAGFSEVMAPHLSLKTMIRMMVNRAFPLLMPLVTSDLGQEIFPALRESPAYADPHWLARRAERSFGGPEPLFLTLFFSTAHFPYAAPHPYYKEFADRSYDGAYLFQKNPEMGLRPEGAAREADVKQVRALYDGALRSVDAEIGRLVDFLKASGRWDSTLIVVTADHGEDLYEDGMLQGHGEHLRGRNVLKVPFVLKLPKVTTPVVKRIGFTTRAIDVAGTVLGTSGLSRAGIGEGSDLTPWILGERQDDPAHLAYAETEIWFARGGDGFFQEKRLDYPGISGLLSFDQGYTGEIVLNPAYEEALITAKHRMIADARWKLIYMPTAHGVEYELYDRKADPDERQNLVASEPERAAIMREKLFSWITEHERGRRLVDGYVVPR